jgi:hypothetical protein
MKPRIFIGSSTEGLDVARFIQAELNKDFECILWNDGEVFGDNDNYLVSLLKAASMFDFGILLATKDDKTEKREKSFDVPRDNVIFEFGIFIGRLGKNRAFVIQEKGIELPSDVLGNQISSFEKEGGPAQSASLRLVIDRFITIIKEKYRQQELGLLPSTGIAIGCFNNFIKKVCDHLFEEKQIIIDGITFRKFEVQIVLPKRLEHYMMSKAELYYAKNDFVKINLHVKGSRPVETMYSLAKKDEGILIIADMPTTLSSLYDSIELYLQKGNLGPSKEMELLEARELNNFRLALTSLLDRNAIAKEYVLIIEE